MGKTRKKCLAFKNYLTTLLHAAKLVFSLRKLSTIKTTHATIGLWSRPRVNPSPTHLVSGRAIVNVDDRLEYIRGIRGLGGEKLPSRPSPKPEKKLFFAIGECARFCRLFSTQQRPTVFVSYAWPTPATYHRPFCEHCCPWYSIRRYVDACRGCVCPLSAVCWMARAQWLC